VAGSNPRNACKHRLSGLPRRFAARNDGVLTHRTVPCVLSVLFMLCETVYVDRREHSMRNILIGVVFYIFAITNMAAAVLIYWRDASRETRIRVLIISELLLHIGLIMILLTWLKN
jgi:hypothetical protein